MAWSENAAGPLAETFDGALGATAAVLGDVHDRVTSAFKGEMTAERLDRVWRESTRDLGPAGPVPVSCHRPAGLILAEVRIAFANGPLGLRIAFESAGQIAGLRNLPSQEKPPPLSELTPRQLTRVQ